MDFGFGSLVDKFDERLGRRVTSAILWLAAVALFVVCAKTIISDGIIPIAKFIRSNGPISVNNLVPRAGEGLLIGTLAALTFSALIQVLTRRIIAKADAHVGHASELLKNLETTRDEAQACLEEAKRLIEAEKKGG